MSKEHRNPKAARLAAGLSPIDLAKRVPCTLSTVYACENAKKFPKHRALRDAYLRALGLAVPA